MQKKYLYLLLFFIIWGNIFAQNGSDGTSWKGTPQEAFLQSEIVQTFQCTSCHTIAERGGTVGPILNQVANRRSEDWIRRWIADPQEVKPGTKMPKFDFNPRQLEMTVNYLINMKKTLNTDNILAQNGSLAEKGEKLFEDYDCLACHRVGSTGRFVGPDLTWIGARKTESWEQTWLTNPSAFKPGTFMPNFHIPEKGIEALAAFLQTQKGQRNEDSQEWEFRTNFFLGNTDKERGELVFKRFACWSCHGEYGSGGIQNPNMAPNEMMPALKKAAAKFTQEALLERLSRKVIAKSLDPSKPAPPFYCPDYGKYMDDSEFSDLYAYLKSFAPKKSKWKFN
ncbi:MAG: c-type cytochrome [bacterium]